MRIGILSNGDNGDDGDDGDGDDGDDSGDIKRCCQLTVHSKLVTF